MAKKKSRDQVKPFKAKTIPKARENKRSAALDEHDLEEGKVAKELLDTRSTAEFSREELGALMQMAPGGAEPHHIRTRSRQFKRQMSNAKPTGVIAEGRTSGNQRDLDDKGAIRRPRSGGPYVSRNNYKIDPED